MAFYLDPNYKQVPERIADFKVVHPEGCLRPVDPARPYWFEDSFDDKGQPIRFLVYAAAAYRTPDDPMPGIGLAWEPVPGRTPYTKLSELQNAETSAWGRAIVAVLASESKAVASAEDVRNRQADHAAPAPPPLTADELAQRAGWRDMADYSDHWAIIVEQRSQLPLNGIDEVRAWMVERGIPAKDCTRAQFETLNAELARRLNPGATVATDPIGSGPVSAPLVSTVTAVVVNGEKGELLVNGEPTTTPALVREGDVLSARPMPTAEDLARIEEQRQRRSDEQAVSFAEKMGHEVPPEIAARHAERLERVRASLAAAEAVHRGETPVDTPEPSSEPQEATQGVLTGDDETLRPNGASDVIRASEFLVARGDKALGETPYDELVALSRAMDLSTKGTAVALRTRIARHICEGLDEVAAMADDPERPF